MNSKETLRIIATCLAVALPTAARLAADYVDTRSGAHIVGKVTKIDAGAVTVSTDYAGDIVVKQKEVTAIVTDGPVSVKLSSGTRLQGTISVNGGAATNPGTGAAAGPNPPPAVGGNPGDLRIVGTDGTIAVAPVSQVSEVWAAGGMDPEIAALMRHWTYEASLNMNGTSGNNSALGTEAGFKATLIAPQDTLEFYTAYNRQVTNGEKATDQFKAGVDYAANFTERSSWYVRDEGGFDRVMDIKFSDVAAAGEGYDFIKNSEDTLTGRVGLSYRYVGYSVTTAPAVSSAGLDLELSHELNLADSVLENKLVYVPAFQDFGNYEFTHVSSYTIPLHEPNWKLKMGVENDYNSLPPPGIKRLDTTYFTQFLLDWQ